MLLRVCGARNAVSVAQFTAATVNAVRPFTAAASPTQSGISPESSARGRGRRVWSAFGLRPSLTGDEAQRLTSVAGVGGGGGEEGEEPWLQPKRSQRTANAAGRVYQGGLLPRLAFTDLDVRLPEHRAADKWVPHRALFGQNDYIDLLSDEPCHLTPRDLYSGPTYALGARNEFEQTAAQLNDPSLVAWLAEHEPSRLKLLRKQTRFAFKWVNKRRNIKFAHYRDAP